MYNLHIIYLFKKYNIYFNMKRKNKNLSIVKDKLKELKIKVPEEYISTLTCSLRNVINNDCYVI
jgi:hypothetical protein